MNTALTPLRSVRRVVATFLLLSLAAVSSAVPASAAPNSGQPVLSIVLKSGPDGPVLPDPGLTIEVPVTAIADRELLAGLDAGARIQRLSVGEPEPQADSTTWSWEICVWISFPDCTFYKRCIGLTITIPIYLPAPVHPVSADVLATKSEAEPFTLCWNETQDDGASGRRCTEVTIKAGGPGRRE